MSHLVNSEEDCLRNEYRKDVFPTILSSFTNDSSSSKLEGHAFFIFLSSAANN